MMKVEHRPTRQSKEVRTLTEEQIVSKEIIEKLGTLKKTEAMRAADLYRAIGQPHHMDHFEWRKVIERLLKGDDIARVLEIDDEEERPFISFRLKTKEPSS
jgi:hypothetical protein